MSATIRQRGFSFIEMIVATALSASVVVALLTVSDNMQSLARDQSERLEMETNLRATLEFLSRDLHLAGYGIQNDDTASQNGVIFPNRNADHLHKLNEITLFHNIGDVRTTLTATMADGWADIMVNSVAGFAIGDRVYVAGLGTDGNFHQEWFTITGTDEDPGEIHFEHGVDTLSIGYQQGAVVLAVTRISFWLDVDEEGRSVLMRSEDEGAPMAVAENLTDLRFTYLTGAVVPIELVNVNSATERRKIRRIIVSATVRTEKRSRITQMDRSMQLTADVSPRNLILGDS